MRTYADGFLDDDEIECRESAGRHCLRIGDLRIFADLGGLARIGAAIERRLREFDTCAPVPAEAATEFPVPTEPSMAPHGRGGGHEENEPKAATGVTVDADDLFAAMACTYDVRRGSWDGEEVAL